MVFESMESMETKLVKEKKKKEHAEKNTASQYVHQCVS